MNQNIVNLQDDLYYALLSWDLIKTINVMQMRKMRLQSDLDFATIYQTPRNGCAGIGIVVEMPTYLMSNNLSGPGPQTELLVTLLVVECPPINLVQGAGTGTDAESVADLLLTLLHQWLIEGQGEIYPQSAPIAPANDCPLGTLGYRVSVKMQHSSPSILRVTQPSITIDGSFNVTLTELSGLPGVQIYFTVDQSPPCSSNPNARLYAGPFQTVVGTVVRWEAWAAGYTPSSIGQAVITP